MAEQMKPSGIEWIGDIPNDWKIQRFKFCGAVLYGCPFNSDFFTNEDTGIPLIRIRDITSGTISTYYEGHYSSEYMVHSGDVLVGMDGDFNVRIWDNLDALLNQRCCKILSSKKINARYLAYYLPHQLYIVNQLTWSTTVKHLLAEDIGNIPVAYPQLNEQQAIADFLDKKCAQIDSIAADLEKQIALLQQYKKSLITETVTKGLDKSVSMKDSGIEGVGTIPSHWTVNRLKYAAVVKTGPFGTQLSASEYSDEGIPVINVKNIGYGTIIEDDLDYVPDEVCQRLAQHQLQLGDIVFGRKGAVDKHAIITKSQIGWVQGSDCIRVRIYGDIDSRYLNYLFDTVYFAEYVLLYAVGTTMASINSDILTNSKILVPPITEQRCIADFLDSNCRTLFEIIENKQSQLATLQQHKKSLIYEYVTGKKRVKEVQ